MSILQKQRSRDATQGYAAISNEEF
jgi:hypothetical protein